MRLYQKYKVGQKKFSLAVLSTIFLFGCGAEGDNTGTEYAPQMYHSVPYEPLSQIEDKEAGEWLTSTGNDEVAEFYNSNPNNPHGMTMRVPAPNTVPRNENGYLPVNIPADTLGSTYWLDYAAANLTNPLDTASDAEAILQEGQALYSRFCFPCHGGAGEGDGPVGQVILGVPSFASGRVQNVSEGHIFHVITHGKGRMGSYASQVDIEERWKIIKYVQQLQNQ